MIAPAAGQPLGMLAAAADGLAAAALLADHNACTPARRALARRNYLFARELLLPVQLALLL
jgi:hypothetical protein